MRLLSAVALALTLSAPPAAAEEPFARPVNLWPLLYRRATADGVETEAFFWLYAHTRTAQRSVTAVRPLFRHETSPGRVSSRLFPLYDYLEEGSRTALGFGGLRPFTLAAFEEDSARHSEAQRVLFWRLEREPGTTDLELPPLWCDSRGPGGRRRVSALGLPDTVNLFESRHDPSRGLAEWHALNFWRRTSPGDSYVHLWPFYGVRRQGARTERSVAWPLAASASDPARGVTERRLWPLWTTSDAALDEDAPSDLALNLALPVPLWYRASAKDRRYRRFLYLHWAVSTPRRAAHVTVPWYSLKDLSTGVSHRGLFPLYHGSRWDDRAFDFAAPLFFRWSDGGSRLSVLFPFYYGHTSGDRSFDYFFPLYGRSARAGRVTQHLFLFPLYSRRAEAGETELDLLWPLFHVGRSSASASVRMLPLYWSGRRGEDSFTLAPLYARVKRGGETRSVLFPLYWRLSAPERETRILPPLGGLVRDGAESDFFLAGLTPKLSLFEWERGPERRVDRALLYYSRREPGARADVLFPLYFRWSDAGRRGLILAPLYAAEDDLSDGSRRRALLGLTGGFSLFEWADEPAKKGRSLRALLFYRAVRGDERTTVLAPLYWSHADAGSSRLWLLPLYAERRAPGLRARGWLGVGPRWSLLSRREEGGAVETRFLWRLVRLRRGPDDDAFELNPLFFTLREGPRRYSAVFGGLIGRETGPDGSRWRWLWVL